MRQTCQFCGAVVGNENLTQETDPWTKERVWVCVDADACSKRGRSVRWINVRLAIGALAVTVVK